MFVLSGAPAIQLCAILSAVAQSTGFHQDRASATGEADRVYHGAKVPAEAQSGRSARGANDGADSYTSNATAAQERTMEWVNAHIRELVVLPPDAMFSGEAYRLV
jgi:hypothetical protein